MLTMTYKRFCGLSTLSTLFYVVTPKKYKPEAWPNQPRTSGLTRRAVLFLRGIRSKASQKAPAFLV